MLSRSSGSLGAGIRGTSSVGGAASPSALRLLVARQHYHLLAQQGQLTPFLASHLAPRFRRELHSSPSVRSPTPSQPTPKDVAATSSPAASQPSSSSEKGVSTKESAPKGTRLQRIWATVKKEALHYWHGTKLLGKEIRISARIQGRLLAGKKLTRREHRQLKRTTQDLLRLIPFSVFVIVPFMELLLPVALKLFPNMLPSTFTDSFKEEEKKRKLLKVRLEMAKFLQETIRESGIKSPDKIKESDAFKEFFRKVRSTGETPTTDEVANVAKLFEDDLTLDNLSRPQLVSMCRYMNINAFGTDNFLRYTIRSRLKQLEQDDRVIQSEGISALSLPELQAACQSRGIRTLGVSEDHLRSELSQWIDLHLQRNLSGTLLILSKAFAFNRPLPGAKEGEEGDDIMRSLKDTLASLPDTLLNETELEVSSDSASYKQRLAVLQEQEELIEDEEEQEAKESEARKAKKEAEEEAKRVEAEQREKEEADKVQGEKAVADEMLPKDEVDVATEDVPHPKEEVDKDDIRMTGEQVTELGSALEILSAKSSVLKERTELRALMSEHKSQETQEGGKPNPLAKRLKNLLTKIDKQLEDYDNEVGGRLNMFETDRHGRIAIRDLRRALEVIRHRPSDDAIEVLLGKLDVDGDGFVPLQELVSLAEGEGLGIVIGEEDAPSEILASSEAIKVDSPEPRPPKPTTTPPPVTPLTAPAPEYTAATVEKKLKKEDVVKD